MRKNEDAPKELKATEEYPAETKFKENENGRR
jgi:hypothetical protein